MFRTANKVLITLAAGISILLLTLNYSVNPLLNSLYGDTLPQSSGELFLPGLKEPASVRRNDLGIPLIEAGNLQDLAFVSGYIDAGDRLTQMLDFRTLSQGRIAEQVGLQLLPIDVYIRTLNLRGRAQQLLAGAGPELRDLLEDYARGVNLYMEQYSGRLPAAVALSDTRPEPWTALDSASIFAVLNLGLSFNLNEEINILNIARTIPASKLAWLLPIYPDEPLPTTETAKLDGIDLSKNIKGLSELQLAQQQLEHLTGQGIGRGFAASNNWAISGSRTQSGRSILANDTHLPLSMPSIWNMKHLRSPELDAAGVTAAGLPAIVAGFNGKLAWGMTMVMADNQDIFLEKLKRIDGKLHYLYQEQWLPTVERLEIFKVQGQEPVKHTIHSTRNGPLLNEALSSLSPHPAVPAQVISRFGLALAQPDLTGDNSMHRMFALSQTDNVDDARTLAQQIGAIPLNMVLADSNNIAWQVTGRYPLRKKGRGLVPSPAWDGNYDWQGWLDYRQHPSVINPDQGWLGTANDRKIPAGFPYTLSSSWYYPERGERIREMIESRKKHDVPSMKQMQYDIYTRFAPKLQNMFNAEPMATALDEAIADLPAMERNRARKTLQILLSFDGVMSADSKAAATFGIFLHSAIRTIFYDELGPEHNPAWQAFLANTTMSYSALQDHLLQRENSPFWGNRKFRREQNKASTLARALADTQPRMVEMLGPQPENWRWGDTHTYNWETDSSKVARKLGWQEQLAITLVDDWFNRGPYPAPGDHNTLNVAAYSPGKNNEVWMIPAMRIIVDFGLEEPMLGLNSSGQSDNPVSPHYDDGISAWINGDYMGFPFRKDNIDNTYRTSLQLLPEF